jgi:mono/diheme cytochrome c family protein
MEGAIMAMQIGRFLLAAAIVATSVATAQAAQSQIERGKYLVTVGGCSDCHTPGTFLGHPDVSKFLGGSDVGFAIPGLGVFAGRNLTPDKETGLGNWTTAQIVKAFTTGIRPDGRTLAPVMPYEAFAHLTHSDALAIAAYLKSLKPVNNAVAGPFGPNDKPTIFVFDVLPAGVYNGLPTPPPPTK